MPSIILGAITFFNFQQYPLWALVVFVTASYDIWTCFINTRLFPCDAHPKAINTATSC